MANGLPPGLLGRRQEKPPLLSARRSLTGILPDTLRGPEREVYYEIFQSPIFNRMSQEKKDEFVRDIGQKPMNELLRDFPGSYRNFLKGIYEQWPDKYGVTDRGYEKVKKDDVPFPDVQPFMNTAKGLLERGEISQDRFEHQFAPAVDRYGDVPMSLMGLYSRSPNTVKIGHYPGWGDEVGEAERGLKDTFAHEVFHSLSPRRHGYDEGVSPQISFAAAVRTLGQKPQGVGDWIGDQQGDMVEFRSLGPLSPEGAMDYLVEIAKKNYTSIDPGRPIDDDLVDKELRAVFTRLLSLPTYRDHPVQFAESMISNE